MIVAGRRVLLGCLVAGLAALPAVVTGSTGDGQGVTAVLPGQAGALRIAGQDLAQLVAGPVAALSPRRVERRLAQDRRWQVVDQVRTHLRLPAGERYQVQFEYVGRHLTETRPQDGLSALARQAVERAPDWMAEMLADKLSRLSPPAQDTFARLVLQAQDPWVDEVAFQIASLAPQTLTHELFSPEIIVENARLIYEHDQVLQYVDVVDYGSSQEGGEYYSTTRYRVRQGDSLEWVEIPRQVYYWYVVEPKLSDELVKKTDEPSDRQATYGYFWREYLFSNPDPAHDYTRDETGRPGAYPVLGDVLARPTVFWDYQSIDLPKGRPFEEDDVALDVLGNWVGKILPRKAMGNRPIQPNQIAFEHNGNCGEIQDLLGAAARTGLVPVSLISNQCEDHAWNEFYTTGSLSGWFPYQVSWEGGPTHINNPGIAYDRDRGGSKDVSAVWGWRPDGLIYDVVDRYSKACSLEVEVRDANGNPVDGAQVLIASEMWQQERLMIADWCYTGNDGRCSFRLGDNQNYYLRVSSGVGDYPPEANTVTRVIADSVADQAYRKAVNLFGIQSRPRFEVRQRSGQGYYLRVKFEVPHQIVYGQGLFGEGPVYADWQEPGGVDVFVMDGWNYDFYSSGGQFTAIVGERDASGGELLFAIPRLTTDWYVVLSNEGRAVNKQVLDAEVTLLWEAALGPEPVIHLPLVARMATLRP